MAFWKKKSEDPWDMDPNQRKRTAALYEQESPDQGEGQLDAVRERWTQRQWEKREALTLPPEACPWCGRNMEQGFIDGGRGVVWHRGVPDTKALWLGTGSANTLRVDTEGVFSTYKITWHCPDCRKMVFDAADMQPLTEENSTSAPEDSFARWDGNPVAPYSAEKQEKEE